MRPVRAKALIINAFALTGRFAIFNPYTRCLGLCAYWAFSPYNWVLMYHLYDNYFFLALWFEVQLIHNV